MKETILNIVEEKAMKEGFDPLLVVESGSRAWGFASEDSDYDVRFVYRYNLSSYLNLFPPSDNRRFSLDIDGADIDGAGWDVYKFFKLLLKSNCQALEWLEIASSDFLYFADKYFVENVRQILFCHRAVSWREVLFHYAGLADHEKTSWLDDEVIVKKYLYMVRSILCCEWVDKRQSMPPINLFDLIQLRDKSDDDGCNYLAEKALELAELKKSTEKTTMEFDSKLAETIQSKIVHFRQRAMETGGMRVSHTIFDSYLRTLMKEK